MLGAVGAAAAFLITQEAMLAAAPVALPLLAIYAGRQRERLQAEVRRSLQRPNLLHLLLSLLSSP